MMGGGGGGSSGKVSYPAYIEAAHSAMLGSGGTTLDLTDVMEVALNGGSPFALLTAFDPGTHLQSMEEALDEWETRILNIQPADDWGVAVDAAVSKINTGVGGEIAAFNDAIDEEVNTKHLPRFQRGMQDINAVQTSSFAIGQAYIEAEALRQKEKYAGQLRREFTMNGVEQITKARMLRHELYKILIMARIERHKTAIIARKEQVDTNRAIDEADAKWDISLFQAAANFIAAPGGGVMVPNKENQGIMGTVLSGLGAGATMLSMLRM